MELNQIASVVAEAEQVATITIYKPNGDAYEGPDGSPCTLSFTGPESRAYAAAKKDLTRVALRQGKRRLDVDDVTKGRVKLAAAPVTAWAGWTDGGTQAPFTPANLEMLLQVEHILAQLEEGISSHGDFFPKSSPSLLTTSVQTPA